MSKHRIGIYPGTFDPITNGHIDIMLRAHQIVDELVVAVSHAYGKKPIFDIDERCEMVNLYLAQYDLKNKVKVRPFDNLLVSFAKQIGASVIIRGLRAISDFEYEFQMSCMNSRLDTNIETIFLPASEKHQFISSRLVKEIASLGGDISSFVIPEVKEKVVKFYANANHASH
jgi:pantetheine-phosphate adenylyltransferase